MKKNISRVRSIAKVVSSASLLALCMSGSTAYAQDPKVIRFVGSAEPKILDPVVNSAAVTMEHSFMVYDTLFCRTSDNQTQPQMVDSYSTSDDGKVFTFKLRSGLVFADGAPVTAADAAASVERWAQRDVTGLELLKLGMKVAVVDDSTFSVSLDTASSVIPDAFAKPAAYPLFVMRAKDAALPITEAVTEYIGSGPFVFNTAEYVPGSKLVYDKNENYVPRSEPADGSCGGKVVNIDQVVWTVMPDAGTAVNALAQGEVDIVEQVSIDLLPILEAFPDVKVETLNSQGAMGWLRMNWKVAPFDNQAARTAMTHLVDQTEYMRTTSGADGTYWATCYSVYSCGGKYENDAGMETYKDPSIDKAKALLSEAGYAGEPVVLIGASDNKVLYDWTMITADRLKAAGVNVDLRMMDYATMLQSRYKPVGEGGEWNAYVTWDFGVTLDNPLSNYNLVAQCEAGTFAGWPCDPELEALRAAWPVAPTAEAADQIALDIQKRAAEDVVFVPLGQFFTPTAYRSNVTGILGGPLVVFWNMDITN
ncbi:ABC transporter substrate-binding protein [Devosia sp. A369]